jgi:dTDP-4-dehydrorhamnose 3,5-epimerase-like enzyme
VDMMSGTAELQGVEFEIIKTFSDQRGYFREVARIDKPFFSDGLDSMHHLVLAANTEKEFKSERIEWLYVPIGMVEVTLHDLREISSSKSQTMQFSLGENQSYMHVKIPAGVSGVLRSADSTAYIFFIHSKNSDRK